MVFRRHRLLLKILAVICIVLSIVAAVVTTILAIILGVQQDSFAAFIVPFISGIGGAAVLFLTSKLIKWLLKDYTELSSRLSALQNSINVLKKEKEAE